MHRNRVHEFQYGLLGSGGLRRPFPRQPQGRCGLVSQGHELFGRRRRRKFRARGNGNGNDDNVVQDQHSHEQLLRQHWNLASFVASYFRCCGLLPKRQNRKGTTGKHRHRGYRNSVRRCRCRCSLPTDDVTNQPTNELATIATEPILWVGRSTTMLQNASDHLLWTNSLRLSFLRSTTIVSRAFRRGHCTDQLVNGATGSHWVECQLGQQTGLRRRGGRNRNTTAAAAIAIATMAMEWLAIKKISKNLNKNLGSTSSFGTPRILCLWGRRWTTTDTEPHSKQMEKPF